MCILMSEEKSELIDLVLTENAINRKKEYDIKNYYNLDELKDLEIDDIYDIFDRTHLIVFVSNLYLDIKKKIRNVCMPCRKCKINFDSCKEITFLPYEYKFNLIDILKYNNKKSVIYRNNNRKSKHQIVFDEGVIRKGVIYRKLTVRNTFTYIPLNKYEYKITEHKIRGFCQIMEELGANKIEIDFSTIKNQIINLSSKNKIEANEIAGNLGFTLGNSKNEENKSVYVLEYPSNNNLILNIRELERNIVSGNYLISMNDYNTNLELQYVINSRCRHFITNYSTTFDLKMESEYNLEMVTQLKIPEINTNNKIKSKKKIKKTISIASHIEFNNKYRKPNELLKQSISLDEVGFNYVMNNINNENDDENLSDEWKIFLWRFVILYVNNLCDIKNNNREINVLMSSDSEKIVDYNLDYENIKNMLEKIKINFSLDEIIKILGKYFDKNSQMKNLCNFLSILDKKTKSYDELGLFLLIESNKKLNNIDSTKELLNYILCKEKSNNKLKRYLHVYDDDSIYQIYNKFLNNGLLNLNNWGSLNMMLEESNSYEMLKDMDSMDINLYYEKIYNNYKIGLSTLEFYENVLPICENILYKLWYESNEIFDIKDLLVIKNSIFEESYKFNKINNYDKLKSYVEKKIEKYNVINKFKLSFEKYINNDENREKDIYENIIEYFNKNSDFLGTSSFVKKKYYLIFKDINVDILKIYFGDNERNIKICGIKLLLYNERLNIHDITLDKYGFLKIRNNLLNGIFSVEFEKLWKPFILKYINFYQKDIYNELLKKYNENNLFFYDFLYKYLEESELNFIITNLIEQLIE